MPILTGLRQMPEPELIVCIVRITDINTHSLTYELLQDQYQAPNIPRYRMDWPKNFPLPKIDSTFEIAAQPNG